MATPAEISVTVDSEAKSMTFNLTPYQADATSWSKTTDVHSPYLTVTGPGVDPINIRLSTYTSEDVPTGASPGQIIPKLELIDQNFVYDATYKVGFYCSNKTLKPDTFANINVVIDKPTESPVLGEGIWTSPNLKVYISIPDTRISEMVATISSGDETKKFHLAADAVLAVRTNGYHEFNLSTDLAQNWTLPTSNDNIGFALKSSSDHDHAQEVSDEYDLIAKPTKPLDFNVVDYTQSATVDNVSVSNLQTFNLLKATVTVTAGQVFDKIEILAPDAYGKYTNVIKSVAYDAVNGTSYDDILLNVELGSVSKYAARIVKGVVASANKVTSGYVIDKYIDPKPLLFAERLTSGYDAAHSASQYDLFELILAANVTSYDRRYINQLQVKAGDDTAFADITVGMLPTAYVPGKNGGIWDVPADGSLKFRVYTDKLGHGQSAEFQIATDELKGYYTEHQQSVVHVLSPDAQPMNAAAIKTDAIKIAYPLMAPNAPSNVSLTALNSGVYVRWEVDNTPNNGNSNNQPTSFIVKIYGSKDYNHNDKPVSEQEVTIPFAEFSGLKNSQKYWASVRAKNDHDYSASIARSAAGAIPLANALKQILTLEKTSFTDPNCNFTVTMAQSDIEIASITVLEVFLNGFDGTKSVVSVNTTQDTYTIQVDAQDSTYGTKYFGIYATAVGNDAATSPPILVSIETGKAPTIAGSMTFNQNASDGKKSTTVEVDIDNHYSELTLAKLVAIPAAPDANENHYAGSVIFDMKKGLAVGSSATNFTYKVTIPYYIAIVDGNKEMASVLAANALGNAQLNSFQ